MWRSLCYKQTHDGEKGEKVWALERKKRNCHWKIAEDKTIPREKRVRPKKTEKGLSSQGAKRASKDKRGGKET